MSWLLVALVIAAGAGGGTAAIAAARRTASAYPRALDAARAPEVVVDLGFGALGVDRAADVTERIETHPDVASAAVAVALLIAGFEDGEPLLNYPSNLYAPTNNERYYTIDRVTVLDGRMPALDAADEVLVNRTFAEAGGIEVGDVLDLAAIDRAQLARYNEAVESGVPPPAWDPTPVPLTVVGVGVLPEQVVQDDVAAERLAVGSPALAHRFPDSENFRRIAVDLRPGTDLDRFFVEVQELIQGTDEDVFFERRDGITSRTQRAIRPHAVALGTVGAFALVATSLVAGQAVARQVVSARPSLTTFRALGATPSELAAASLAPVAVTVGLALAAGAGIAVLLSPLGPAGPVRAVEPEPGIDVDVVAMLVGLASVAVLVAIRVGAAGRRAVLSVRRLESGPSSRSRVADWLARAGAPPTGVLGVRQAFGTGAGRTAARLSLGSCIAATAAVVALLVFVSSIAHVVRTPRLYGVTWDATVMFQGGYGADDLQPVERIRADSSVSHIASVAFAPSTIDGREVPAVGLFPDAGDLHPPVTGGRFPTEPGELAVGEDTLAQLGRGIGDRVEVTFPGEPAETMEIVGTVVLPSIGFSDVDRPGLGVGAITTLPDELAEQIVPGAVLVQLDHSAAAAEFARRHTDDKTSVEVFIDPKPADIAAFDRLGAGPAVLGAVFALAALASVAHAVLSVRRAHRRDDALFAALGMRPRQRATVVIASAVTISVAALLVGVPLGLAVGRLGWTAIASDIGVVAEPVTPVGPVVAVIVLGLAVAAVLAAIPAAGAVRSFPAPTLRRE